MKKLLLLFAALILGFSVKAQCPLTQAVDFTATDVHGETFNLFEILDGGQYVLIDFFFTTCGPCQTATPKIVESYYTMGCNQHEVFYIEVDTGDSEAQCLNWVENYGVEYPTISGEAGGSAICDQYGIDAYPTVILIAPNRQIVIQDLWPISNAQTVVNALQAQGLSPHECNTSDGAPDFTTNDINGNEIHLYDILDAGQAVCINFFLSIDPTSVNIMPAVVEAYEKFGCNQHDIFFMEISPYDQDAGAQTWAETHGVEYPTISKDGGGNTIAQSFMVGFYPTVMLILPDHSIAIPDVAPIYTSAEIINAFEEQGMEQHPCDGNADVEVTVGEVTATTVTASFTPNEACASYYYMIGIESEMQMWQTMMGLSLEQLVQQWGIQTAEAETYTWEEQTPNTEYTIYVLPMNADGSMAELVTETVTTLSNGGEGEALVDLVIEPVSETSVRTIATPNDQVSSFHYGLITKDYFNELGQDAAVEYFQTDPYVFYGVDDHTWTELEPNTFYYGIATAQNALGEWGTPTIVEFYTSVTETSEGYSTITLFPVPADNAVTLTGAKHGTIRIYNTLGQTVDEFESNSGEFKINTSNYENGIYFIQMEEKTMKFVVRH